jgi:hypothetical protein
VIVIEPPRATANMRLPILYSLKFIFGLRSRWAN